MKRTNQIEIVPFEPHYAVAFKDLNLAWLEKYFYVEPKDEILLKKCKKTIVDTGGFIFFAKLGDEIVGCFSLIKRSENNFELGKMAVSEAHQGHSIGQALMQFAITFAKKQKWHNLILYSSTKLPAALHIYRKYGFVEIPLEKDLPYARSDIKMKLVLLQTCNQTNV